MKTLPLWLFLLSSSAHADYLYTFSIEAFQVGDTVFPADVVRMDVPGLAGLPWDDQFPLSPVSYDGVQMADLVGLYGMTGNHEALFARDPNLDGILPIGPIGTIVGFITPPIVGNPYTLQFSTTDPFRIMISNGSCLNSSCQPGFYQATGTVQVRYMDPPPVNTPEPSTAPLLLLGVSFILILHFKK